MFFNKRIIEFMSRLFTSLIAAAGIFSCSAAANSNYNITVNFTPDEDGLLLYMVNYDNGVKIDSAEVVEGVAKMQGTVNAPVMAQLVLDGNRAGSFILEPATITVDTNKREIKSTGTLNNEWDRFNAQLQAIAKEYRTVMEAGEPGSRQG